MPFKCGGRPVNIAARDGQQKLSATKVLRNVALLRDIARTFRIIATTFSDASSSTINTMLGRRGAGSTLGSGGTPLIE